MPQCRSAGFICWSKDTATVISEIATIFISQMVIEASHSSFKCNGGEGNQHFSPVLLVFISTFFHCPEAIGTVLVILATHPSGCIFRVPL
jgi:hypothetical protein